MGKASIRFRAPHGSSHSSTTKSVPARKKSTATDRKQSNSNQIQDHYDSAWSSDNGSSNATPSLPALDQSTEDGNDGGQDPNGKGSDSNDEVPEFGLCRLVEDADEKSPNIGFERKQVDGPRGRPNVSRPLARNISNDARDIDDFPIWHDNLLPLRQTG